MKKNKSAFVIAAVFLFLAICFIGGMSVRVARREGYFGMSYGFSLGGVAKLRNTIEIPLEKADSLTLEYGSKNIKIYPAGDGQITIKEYLYSGSAKALSVVNYSGDKQVVVMGGSSRSFVLFGFFMGEGERIEVYIPEKSLGELYVETGSGNITSKTDCTKSDGILTMQAGSGNISLDNVEVKELSVQAGSGNIKVKELTGESLRLQVNSGNISGEKLAGKLYADSGSGNIDIKRFSGSGSAEAGSGNVTVEAESVSGDMELEAGSGNVKLELPKELKFYFEGKTSSGNLHTDFDEFLSYDKRGKKAQGEIGDIPSVKILVKTGSGNINVKY